MRLLILCLLVFVAACDKQSAAPAVDSTVEVPADVVDVDADVPADADAAMDAHD